MGKIVEDTFIHYKPVLKYLSLRIRPYWLNNNRILINEIGIFNSIV